MMLVENQRTCKLVVKGKKTKFDKEKYNIIIQRKITKIVMCKRRFNEAYFSCRKQFNFPPDEAKERERERGYRVI